MISKINQCKTSWRISKAALDVTQQDVNEILNCMLFAAIFYLNFSSEQCPAKIPSFIDQSDITDLLHSQMQNCHTAGDDFLFKEQKAKHWHLAYVHIVNGNTMCLTGLCGGNLALTAVSNPNKDRKCRFRKIYK